MWPHTGAILAGGASTRMGRTKASMPMPGGESMIEHVTAALQSVCTRVVVVGGDEEDAIADLRPGLGPLGGIEALLTSGLDERYLVCPCDMPLVTDYVFGALTVDSDTLATVLRIDDEMEPRPLPARIDAAALDIVRQCLDEGRRAVHHALDAMDPHVITLPSSIAGQLANVNTPEEYRALRP